MIIKILAALTSIIASFLAFFLIGRSAGKNIEKEKAATDENDRLKTSIENVEKANVGSVDVANLDSFIKQLRNDTRSGK